MTISSRKATGVATVHRSRDPVSDDQTCAPPLSIMSHQVYAGLHVHCHWRGESEGKDANIVAASSFGYAWTPACAQRLATRRIGTRSAYFRFALMYEGNVDW